MGRGILTSILLFGKKKYLTIGIYRAIALRVIEISIGPRARPHGPKYIFIIR